MLSEKQKQVIISINHRANQILRSGGDDETLLSSMLDIMDLLKDIMDSSTHDELDAYCQQYKGFYRYMKLLERLALGISNGTITVPQ